MSRILKASVIIILAAALGLGSLAASGGLYDAYKLTFGEARWQTKYNQFIDAIASNVAAQFAALSNLITNWAPQENQDILIPNCTYSSGTNFTVAGDLTGQFVANAKVRVDLGSGTLKGSYVGSSSYATGTTTVVLHDSILTNPLSGVWVTATRNGLFPYGPGYVVARDYGVPGQQALVDALAAIGVLERTLILSPGTWALTADQTIPANINLKVSHGAILSVATGKTLTINGSLEAGLYQIFSCAGTGKVVFGPLVKDIYPEWFNNNLTLTLACASPYSRIVFLGQSYTTDGVSLIVNYVTLYSPNKALISQNVAGAASSVLTIASDYVTIDGLTIAGQIQAGQEADATGKACIFITGTGPVTRTGVTIRNCRLTGKQQGIICEMVDATVYLADLLLENNYIRALHYGILGGNYYADAVVNNNVRILNNDVEVTAGSYTGFANARAIQFINTNNLIIKNNRSLGGFSGIETYGGYSVTDITEVALDGGGSGYTIGDVLTITQGAIATATVRVISTSPGGVITQIEFIPGGKGYTDASNVSLVGGTGTLATVQIISVIGRPYQRNVQITGNTTDGHVGFTQVVDGVCSDNVVDMGLRNPSWPKYDNATVLSLWTYLAGIEAGSLDNCVVTSNTVRNQVGAGIQIPAHVARTVFNGNTIYMTGITATPPAYAAGIFLDGKLYGVDICNNVIEGCAAGGIQQYGTAAYNSVNRLNILGNTITNVQRWGIQVWKGADITISGNKVSNPNMSAGPYDGISDYGVAGYIDKIKVSNNTIYGGRFGVLLQYATNASASDNYASGAAINSYAIIGQVKNNRDISGISTISQSGEHITNSYGYDSVVLDPGAGCNITNIDSGSLGNILTIYFARADTVMVNNALYLKLAYHVNVTPTAGSIMTFLCVSNPTDITNMWVEISRTIY